MTDDDFQIPIAQVAAELGFVSVDAFVQVARQFLFRQVEDPTGRFQRVGDHVIVATPKGLYNLNVLH